MKPAQVCTSHAIVRGDTDSMILMSAESNGIHPVTAIHRCNGTHTKMAGEITLHHCDCGAIFYAIRDAVTVLVSKLASLQAQVYNIEASIAEELGVQ